MVGFTKVAEVEVKTDGGGGGGDENLDDLRTQISFSLSLSSPFK